MGHLTLGREMYYINDRINQKEIPSDEVLLASVVNALGGRDSFMICGQSFDLLHKVGFVETCVIDAEQADPVYYVNVISQVLDHREQDDFQYHRTFQKIDGDIVTELYFVREKFAFHKNFNDYFYTLILKGSYLKSSLQEGELNSRKLSLIKFPKMKAPTIIAYKENGDIITSCTVTKDRNIWYFNNSHKYVEGIYKQYESTKLFDVSIVNYTHKKRIESVVFMLGNRQVSADDVRDVLPELASLKPSEQINWEDFVTPEQLLVLEMNHI